MKKIVLLFNLLLISQLSFSQNIVAGSETFDKVLKEGAYMIMSVDQKYLEKDWANYLARFGSVQNKKDVYTIAAANIPAVSSSPVILTSKLTGQKGKTTVFTSYDLGGGTMVTQGGNGYDGAQKLMQDFYNIAAANEVVRLAQVDLDAAQSNYDKSAKTGEKLVKNIEGNKKDNDKLLKKIDENKAELDQLIKDQASNKLDQDNTRVILEEKRKAVEAVRLNVPKI